MRRLEIVDAAKQNFATVAGGDPADPGTYMGPLISEQQHERWTRW
jgi:acyl-CoA reductase-like NAD-dependent aldehyde dehydrogenase